MLLMLVMILGTSSIASSQEQNSVPSKVTLSFDGTSDSYGVHLEVYSNGSELSCVKSVDTRTGSSVHFEAAPGNYYATAQTYDEEIGSGYTGFKEFTIESGSVVTNLCIDMKP